MDSELTEFLTDLRRFITNSLRGGVIGAATGPEVFEDLSVRLFRLQHHLNPPYRTLCNERGVLLDDVMNVETIPSVSTSAFKEYDFSCLPCQERSFYFESSGTTQATRSRTFHSSDSIQLYEAVLLPWFQQHLLPEISRPEQSDLCRPHHLLSLTPPTEHAPHSSLVHMLDAVSRRPWFQQSVFAGIRNEEGAWVLNLVQIQQMILQAVRDQFPLLLVGTAFNFVYLLDHLKTQSVHHRLPPGSRIMETGGYKGRSRELSRDELHLELTETLGVTPEYIITEYGMTELGSQAYDQVAGALTTKRILHFPPWAKVSIVSTETGLEVADGQIGLVRITDLANTFSVLSVETEDLAIRRGEGLELIGRNAQAEPRGCSLMTV